ncbi:MAG TPA: hypothetical protein VGN12_12535 [Pirellulales bacterium]|jgi:hypothetical protein
MDTTKLDRLIDALVYEGYLLYPYRPAIKNQVRWTFGGVYPRSWSEAEPGRDRWRTRANLLHDGVPAVLEIQVRFLQIVDRVIAVQAGDDWDVVPCLTVDDTQYHSWQECRERRVELSLNLRNVLAQKLSHRFAFSADESRKEILALNGQTAGMLIRRQVAVRGRIEILASPVGENASLIEISVANETEMPASAEAPQQSAVSASAADRAAASSRALAATHAVVRTCGGQFVSSIDPSPEYRAVIDSHPSDGLWPVLVGPDEARDTMLCSPIILYDYPQIAEESHGDFFDATEIDEMLTLRVLTLSDDEKRQVAAFDERGQALLNRTRALAERQLATLHGVTRQLGSGES